MQDLKLFNTNITMSSSEISELTGKRHDNVMTDITKLLKELNLHAPDFSGTQKYGNNNTRNIYNLPRRECDLLMMGYSIEMRAKVYDRWVELEQKYIPNKPLTELELAKKYVEALEYIEKSKPKIEAFDNAKAIFSKKEKVYDKEVGYKKDILKLYPFIGNDKLSMILEYYTKSKFKDTNKYIKDELSCVEVFFSECDMEVKPDGKSVAVSHECLLGRNMFVRKEPAIKYLGYCEEDFE